MFETMKADEVFDLVNVSMLGTEANVIELVTFIQRYHIITVHKHTRKTPHETSAKTNG